MVSFLYVMWAVALFFALMGALRGWHRELIGTIGIVLGFFAIFQFDALLRGSLYLLLTDAQTFLLQAALFAAFVMLAYRHENLSAAVGRGGWRNSALGAAVGLFNGYFAAGAIWYFLDINRYPFAQLVAAPAENSVSFQALDAMPIVLFSGGLAGNGDLLSIVIIVLLAIVTLIV